MIFHLLRQREVKTQINLLEWSYKKNPPTTEAIKQIGIFKKEIKHILLTKNLFFPINISSPDDDFIYY